MTTYTLDKTRERSSSKQYCFYNLENLFKKKMGKKFMKTNRHKKLKAVDPFYTGDRKLLIDKYYKTKTFN